MKKLLLFLLSLSLFLPAASALAEGGNVVGVIDIKIMHETYTYGNFEYALLENGDAELIRYNGPEGNVNIPYALDGHPITAVRGNPFYYYNSPDDSGIKNCTISVPVDHPYLATIDGVLFGQSDRRLISYFPSLPGTALSVNDELWEDIAWEYEIPQGIQIIGENAFYHCTELEGVIIPDSVTSIGYSAFEGCTGLRNVTIPDGVTSIEAFTFCDCTGLKSVTIPDSVTSIGNCAFSICKGLTVVIIPNSVTTIESQVFYDCTELTSVTIPDSVTSIDNSAFNDCPNLTLTVAPGSYAESYCINNGLSYIYLGTTYGDNDSWLN